MNTPFALATKLLSAVREAGDELGCNDIWVVGGFVRDLLIGVYPVDPDIDLTLEHDTAPLVASVAKRTGGKVETFPEFLTQKITDLSGFGQLREIDFARTRQEIYEVPGALPTVTPASLREDLRRRDFTMNAIAVPLHTFPATGSLSGEALLRSVVDPYRGCSDISGECIRVIHDRSFHDDPTRILRAFRYMGRLGWSLDAHTAQLAKEALQAEVFSTISSERVIRELQKILREPRAFPILEKLRAFGVLSTLSLVDDEVWKTIITFGTEAEHVFSQTAVADRWDIFLSLLTRIEGADLARFRVGKKRAKQFLERARGIDLRRPSSLSTWR